VWELCKDLHGFYTFCTFYIDYIFLNPKNSRGVILHKNRKNYIPCNEEKGTRMNNAWKKYKQKFEENPVQVLFVTAMAVTAAAKLIDAVSAAQGRHAYAKQVNLRARGL
jgi:hypothetical protein